MKTCRSACAMIISAICGTRHAHCGSGESQGYGPRAARSHPFPMRPSTQAPPPTLCFPTLPLTTYRISHARHTHTLPRLRLRLILIRFRSAPPAVGGVASNYHRAFPNGYSSLSKHELIWSPTPQSQRQKVDTPSLGSVICALLRVRSVGCPA